MVSEQRRAVLGAEQLVRHLFCEASGVDCVVYGETGRADFSGEAGCGVGVSIEDREVFKIKLPTISDLPKEELSRQILAIARLVAPFSGKVRFNEQAELAHGVEIFRCFITLADQSEPYSAWLFCTENPVCAALLELMNGRALSEIPIQARFILHSNQLSRVAGQELALLSVEARMQCEALGLSIPFRIEQIQNQVARCRVQLPKVDTDTAQMYLDLGSFEFTLHEFLNLRVDSVISRELPVLKASELVLTHGHVIKRLVEFLPHAIKIHSTRKLLLRSNDT